MLKAGLALLFAAGAVTSLALLPRAEFAARTRAALVPDLEEQRDDDLASASDAISEPEPAAPDDKCQRRRHVDRRITLSKPATVPDLAKAGGWMRSLAVHHALPRLATPEAEQQRLATTLSQATNPVARQNVIFLAVLTLPTEVSHPWLFDLKRGGLGGDAEDALLALAFDGDPGARAEFGWLAKTPSRAPVHRLVDDYPDHEELGETGTEEAREILRSYRALEVLDREPYFKFTFYATKHVAWVPHPARPEHGRAYLRTSRKQVVWPPPDDPALELDRELLAPWIARYPGHPGSDDMAWRIGRAEKMRGMMLDAARWFSRAATMPDQDLCDSAIEELVTVSELDLSHEELDRLAHEEGLDPRNRALLQYIRLRRLAAVGGVVGGRLQPAGGGRAEPPARGGWGWY